MLVYVLYFVDQESMNVMFFWLIVHESFDVVVNIMHVKIIVVQGVFF